MEVNLIITSACLTGQFDLERAEEWLGLPLALQSVWKTKAMLLTLWEVQELPAMIWVVEVVKALTHRLSAGEAQKIAQEKVKNVTEGEVEALWLSEAQQRLPEDRWRKVYNKWRETSRSTDQRPFSAPVHWAPFILIGNPKVTISPKRGSY
jgi:CHAT domain-containing protein